MIPKNVIDAQQFNLLLKVVQNFNIGHGAGYNAQDDYSYLRIDHGNKHMLFAAYSYNMNLDPITSERVMPATEGNVIACETEPSAATKHTGTCGDA